VKVHPSRRIMQASPASAATRIPVHVAIVMDGNGRWAEERNRPRLFGHKAGVSSVRTVVETAREIGILHLTLYAFSTENWKRPSAEVKGLMNLLKGYLQSELETMLKNDIRLLSVGQQDRLSSDVRKILNQTMARTSAGSAMTLNLALSYGSRDEIVQAARTLAGKCLDGELTIEDLSEEQLNRHLYTAGQPDPDLFIRTGGEHRLSNFLLWQLSYAELYFTDIKWPDFGREALMQAIASFSSRQRRFGRTGAQLQHE
jgi:undecaprenyl diphosphate synthase